MDCRCWHQDGRPYEIFTGKLENGLTNLPNNIKECEVVKNIIEIEELNEMGKPVMVKRKDMTLNMLIQMVKTCS